MQQVEDDVHVVHLHHDFEVQVLAFHQVVEGVAGLQSLAGQYEVVTLQVGEFHRRQARQWMTVVDDGGQSVAEDGAAVYHLVCLRWLEG